MVERRKHDRSRAFAAGTIAWGRHRATLDCVVRDLSDGGALLLLDEPRRAPAEMVLALRGGTRGARVVWRGEVGVGVSFTPVGSVAAAVPASADVVNLDERRRERTRSAGDRLLLDRIARFVGRTAPPPVP